MSRRFTCEPLLGGYFRIGGGNKNTDFSPRDGWAKWQLETVVDLLNDGWSLGFAEGKQDASDNQPELSLGEFYAKHKESVDALLIQQRERYQDTIHDLQRQLQEHREQERFDKAQAFHHGENYRLLGSYQGAAIGTCAVCAFFGIFPLSVFLERATAVSVVIWLLGILGAIAVGVVYVGFNYLRKKAMLEALPAITLAIVLMTILGYSQRR